MVAVGMRNPTRERILDEFLSPFLEIAASQPASVLKTVMRRWADQVDPLTEVGDERDAYRRRYLNVDQVGDGVYLEGFFDNTDGAKVMAAVNAAMARHFRASRSQPPGSSCAQSIGEASLGVGMPSQARADAFISSIIDLLLASGELPTAGGSRAAVTVTVPLARLERPCGAPTDAHLLAPGDRRCGRARATLARVVQWRLSNRWLIKRGRFAAAVSGSCSAPNV